MSGPTIMVTPDGSISIVNADQVESSINGPPTQQGFREGATIVSGSSPKRAETTMSEQLHSYRRFPEVAGLDKRAPRMFVPDDYMAIEPRALEKMFFPSFFGGEEEKPYDMYGALAIISIDGPLMQRGGWWWDGYESIRERFEKALEDKAVGAVLLKISSPGGVCAGCFSATRAMQAAKKESGKRVFAFADESAYSAAYAMACIADEIYLPREGGVGSVGVIGTLEDWTAYNDKQGIKVAVITSGKHKADGHPDVPLKPDVIKRYQARIDQLGLAFAEVVAEARGMSSDDVLKLEADCFYGESAVVSGLANAVKDYEDVLDLAAESAAKRVVSESRSSRSATKANASQIIVHRWR